MPLIAVQRLERQSAGKLRRFAPLPGAGPAADLRARCSDRPASRSGGRDEGSSATAGKRIAGRIER
jgi:hypothetical protein